MNLRISLYNKEREQHIKFKIQNSSLIPSIYVLKINSPLAFQEVPSLSYGKLEGASSFCQRH